MVVALLLLLLAACHDCDDPCRVARVEAALPGDLDAVVREARRIEDPVLRAATILRVAQDPSLALSPDQVLWLCEATPNEASRQVCMQRNTRPHLMPSPTVGSPGAR